MTDNSILHSLQYSAQALLFLKWASMIKFLIICRGSVQVWETVLQLVTVGKRFMDIVIVC